MNLIEMMNEAQKEQIEKHMKQWEECTPTLVLSMAKTASRTVNKTLVENYKDSVIAHFHELDEKTLKMRVNEQLQKKYL